MDHSFNKNTAARLRLTARFLLAALIAAFVLSLVFSVNTNAAEGISVYDYQDYFTAEEESDLETRFSAFERKHGIRMFLMTPGVDEVGGYDDQDSIRFIEEFSEDTINADCIGLLINMDTRYFYIDVYGEKAINAFTDDKQMKIEDAVVECLYTEDIHGAGVAFAEQADTLVDQDPRKGRTIKGGIVAAVIGLIGSLGMMGARFSKHKEKRIATDADIYADQGSLVLTLNRDRFSHQYVTRVARIQNSRGGGFGGGTTTHRSMGGHMHSGGGRHF